MYREPNTHTHQKHRHSFFPLFGALDQYSFLPPLSDRGYASAEVPLLLLPPHCSPALFLQWLVPNSRTTVAMIVLCIMKSLDAVRCQARVPA